MVTHFVNLFIHSFILFYHLSTVGSREAGANPSGVQVRERQGSPWRTCKLHTETPRATSRFKPGTFFLWDGSVNHSTTVQPKPFHLKQNVTKIKFSSNSLVKKNTIVFLYEYHIVCSSSGYWLVYETNAGD